MEIKENGDVISYSRCYPPITDNLPRAHVLAEAALRISELEAAASEPYRTAYRKAKDTILAMIVERN